VRPDINSPVLNKLGGTHLVEKDERPYHLAMARRQSATNLEPAQVMGAGNYQRFEGIRACGFGAVWLFAFVPAHLYFLICRRSLENR